MGKLICPNCGSEVVLPEHSTVAVGITFSEESVGTHYLNMKKEKKNMNAQERFDTLKAQGMDMSKYFILGDDLYKATSDGRLEKWVEDGKADPIAEQIISDNYVRNTKLHRRWVLAQMWSMLNYKYKGESGYDAALRSFGYGYQWSMMVEELHVLAELEKRDRDTFLQRVMFFDMVVVSNCYEDFLEKVTKHVMNLKKKKCKGVPYVTFGGKNIFVSDLSKKVYQPIVKEMNAFARCKNYEEAYKVLRRFVKNYVERYRLPWETPMCKYFKDAYKGAGAYYSLRNLVQFHNCKLHVSPVETLSGTKALEYMDSKLDEYRGEGWRYFAMMKKCIEDNNWAKDWK